MMVGVRAHVLLQSGDCAKPVVLLGAQEAVALSSQGCMQFELVC